MNSPVVTFITTVVILILVAAFFALMWKSTGRAFPWEHPERPAQTAPTVSATP
jgi:hypothetical protein